MRRVAITGISGHLGGKLLQRFDQDNNVESIIGIDTKEPKYTSPKLKSYRHDVSEPFDSVIAENEVDSLIHLAFIVVPGHKTAKDRGVNVGGTQNFLRAAQHESVKWLLFPSSCTAYGGYPDNPVPITEDHPLRIASDYPYSWHKRQCEQMIQDFTHAHPEKRVTLLRVCPVLGAKGVGSGVKELFTPVIMVRCIGYNPLWQFVHDEDWAGAVTALMQQQPTGVFNLAGHGHIPYTEVASILGRKVLPLPGWLLKPVLVLSWKLYLQSKSPVAGLQFLKYPVVLSNEKIQQAAGYKIQYSSHQALDAYLSK